MKKRKIEPQEDYEREVEETTEMITGEDVMEATAYMANASDCCSAEEKAENVLGMLGANIIDLNIYHTEEEHENAQEESEIEEEAETQNQEVVMGGI